MNENLKNILLLSPDVIGEKIAGPGVRYWEMAKALSAHFNIALLVPGEQSLPKAEFTIKKLSRINLKKHLSVCDVVTLQGMVLEQYPEIKYSGKYLVIDIYDPIMLEKLEDENFLNAEEKNKDFHFVLNSIRRQLSIGDFFICSSEKQRDFWLGMLTAIGRVNPSNYDFDKSFRKIIDIVPFGLPTEIPISTRKVLKGIHPGIDENDFVILWGGGVWNWLDPLTPIKAMKVLSRERPNIKLFFLGNKHPNGLLPKNVFKMQNKAFSLAGELKLLNKTVFFNETWTKYSERANYLLEADIGISCHFKLIETEYSFRTRILDYLWANLPIVTSEGDSISKLVSKEGLGVVVECENSQSLANVILKLYENKNLLNQYRESAKKISKYFTWDNAVKPLICYCQNPYFAPDKLTKNKIPMFGLFQDKMIKAYKLLCSEGITSLIKRIISFIRRKLNLMFELMFHPYN